MRTFLVTGASANLGRRVVVELAARGWSSKALSRQARAGPADGTVVGDLAVGSGLVEAVDGVDAIIHCASEPRRSGVDTRLMANLVAAASASPRRPPVIYISIVGCDRIPLAYYKTKHAAETLLAQQADVGWSILRATQFHDFIRSLAAAAARSPLAPALAGTRFQPVDAGEVARRLCDLAAMDPTGRIDEIGGPEIQPHAGLVRQYLRAAGRRRPVLPIWLPGALGRGFRSGANLTPQHAEGTITFDDFLRSGHAGADGAA